MPQQNSGSFIEIKNISKIFGNTSKEALDAITKQHISKQHISIKNQIKEQVLNVL